MSLLYVIKLSKWRKNMGEMCDIKRNNEKWRIHFSHNFEGKTELEGYFTYFLREYNFKGGIVDEFKQQNLKIPISRHVFRTSTFH
jgi:hypothetical protein